MKRTSVGLNCFCEGRFYICFFSVLSCSFYRFSHEYDNSAISVGAFRRCRRRTWLKPTFYFHFEIMSRSKQQGTRHFLKHMTINEAFITRTKNKHLHLFFKTKYTEFDNINRRYINKLKILGFMLRSFSKPDLRSHTANEQCCN